MILMAVLNPKALALIEAGRSALRAKPADRERVEGALRAQLGQAVLPLAASGAAHVARSPWHFAPQLVIGVALLGSVGFWAWRPVATPPPSPAWVKPAAVPSNVVSSTPSAPSQVAAPATSAQGVEAPQAAAESVASSPPRAQDRLAQEVALLSRATSDLRAGRAAEALKALDEHRRKFPNGTLSEERRAARAQALCSLGRIDEGRTELSLLAPRSPAAARARQVCDAMAARKE